MAVRYCTSLFVALSCLLSVSCASPGDAYPNYRACVRECEVSGCVGKLCFPQCNSSSSNGGGPWYTQEPLYLLQWQKWGCQGDCRYHCMVNREKERETLGHSPLKYHGKWPFKRLFGIQEPASVAFSVLNLAMHFHGWLFFFVTLYYKLPLKQDKTAYYEYVGLWHIYGLLSMNSWFWSAVFHTRDVDITERLDYSSAIAVLGFSLIVSILRTFDVRVEAARVMVSTPVLAFVTTHILYINFYKLDYGWNMIVCVAMGVAQLLLWARWAAVSRHPSIWKLWVVVIASGLAMLLEIYDFPPYEGYFDAHSIWHTATVPLTFLWWSFVRDDAEFRTSSLLKKSKTKAK